MNTLKQFSKKPTSIPSTTAWYLADIGEAKGMQNLFIKQSPHVLKALREHALIESAVSSNRIEGVEIEKSRIGTVIFGKPHLRDRNEEEVKGYREALNLIHEKGKDIPLSEKSIMDFHRMLSGEIWDSGKYKDKESNIIQKYTDGRERIRFKTIAPKDTPRYMKELIVLGNDAVKEQWVHPLISAVAFNLDFLCVHPFRDGNGRVSRLLLLLQSYHLDIIVGRYVSFERLIEDNKERYYETLEESSKGWHTGKHDPWPYINFILYVIKTAYKEFQERFEKTASTKGAKTGIITESIRSFKGEFTMADIERLCPGVSHDMIKKVFTDLKKNGDIEPLGRGPGAQWVKKG
jgi:Fic family protein